MKTFLSLLVAVVLLQGFTFSQVKPRGLTEKDPLQGIVDRTPVNSNFLFGLIDPSKITMSHSYSMSYSTSTYGNLALSDYVNTIGYSISDRMQLQVQTGIRYSPFSSFGKDFENSISGIYLKGASFQYQISDDSKLEFRYEQLPVNYFNDPFRYGGRYGYSPYDVSY